MAFRRRTPRQVPATASALLDSAYDERVQALERIRTAADSVHASRARLEAARRTWVAAVRKLEQQAREAITAGDEDAARVAAARCVPLDADIAAADERLEAYARTEGLLAEAAEIAAQQRDALRRRRESLRGAPASAAAVETVRATLRELTSGYDAVQRALLASDDSSAAPPAE